MAERIRIKIEKRTWEHEPRPQQPDYRGKKVFCVVDDDDLVLAHYPTRNAAMNALPMWESVVNKKI